MRLGFRSETLRSEMATPDSIECGLACGLALLILKAAGTGGEQNNRKHSKEADMKVNKSMVNTIAEQVSMVAVSTAKYITSTFTQVVVSLLKPDSRTA